MHVQENKTIHLYVMQSIIRADNWFRFDFLFSILRLIFFFFFSSIDEIESLPVNKLKNEKKRCSFKFLNVQSYF